MKKIDLGQALSLLANVGVIAGIIFLGFELHQNQVLGRAEVRNEIARAESELTIFDVENNMIDYLKRMGNGDRSEEVQDAIRMRSALWLRHYQNVYYQYQLGLFDSEELEPIMTGLMENLNEYQMMRENFCSRTNILSPGFVAAVQSRLSAPCE